MRGHRFTIFDALEKGGYFDSNPANSFARDLTTGNSTYRGPVEFPKMLYHPEGEERIVVPAEIISTPMGPKAVGEQREMLHQIVANRKEEEALVAEGWLDHPAKAVRRRVELFIERNPEISEKEKTKLLAVIPNISQAAQGEARIRELERKLAELTAEGEEAPLAPPARVSGPLQPLASASSLGARFAPTPPAS